MESTELELLQAALGDNARWYVVAMAGVLLAIRVLRTDAIQAAMPVAMQWARLKGWAKLGIVGASALLASWVTAMLAGQTVWVALGGAVVTALGAVGGHKVTRAIGIAETSHRLTRDAVYMPGRVRKAASIIVPLDKRAIEASHRIERAIQASHRIPDLRGPADV